MSRLPYSVNIDIKYYLPYTGPNQVPRTTTYTLPFGRVPEFFVSQPSGAYIFRPVEDSLTALTPNDTVTEVVGTDFTEWRIAFQEGDWASLVIRQFTEDSQELEVEWMVGPMPGERHSSF